MSDYSEKIKALLHQLDTMSHQQARVQKELSDLRKELILLQENTATPTVEKEEFIADNVQPSPNPPEQSRPQIELPPKKSFFDNLHFPEIKADTEKFIGENLINKVGIILLVFGVAIGAKYAIDHQLISPLTRIILGYLTGVGLLGFAIKLKANYKNFSAVLLSGAIAVFYFITFAAYDFYALLPQTMAFGMMVIFTIFSVVAALHYDQQVIAVLGLVGAYAIPFLLSNESGNALFLLSYIALVNIGILVIAFRKYWKVLYYLSFFFTWLILGSWLVLDYEKDTQFALGIGFTTLFFLLFYATFLAYKLIKNEQFEVANVILLLLNSFLFFGIGYALLNEHPTGQHLLGVFALFNALIHFAVTFIVYRRTLSDKKLFFFVAGLVLIFLTIAIPIQLDGNWVTLIWAGEAALLFWIGRTHQAKFYEKLSYPIMILSLFSLIDDWSRAEIPYYYYADRSYVSPVFNITFLTGLLFSIVFGFILWWHFRHPEEVDTDSKKSFFSRINTLLIGGIFLIALFYTGFFEINNYWAQAHHLSAVAISDSAYQEHTYNHSILDFKFVWLNNYCMIFLVALSFFNMYRLKNKPFGIVNLIANTLMVFAFLVISLYHISELREAYLYSSADDLYQRGVMYLLIRYISLAFFAGLLVAIYRYTRAEFMHLRWKNYAETFFYCCLIWVASSELLHWMDFGGAKNQYKLGLSILWGVFSLAMICVGIVQRKKFIRIGAILLFGITLIKLFFYDIAHLDTVPKTIVMVSLGILLLIISFLYNKFKDEIADNHEQQKITK